VTNNAGFVHQGANGNAILRWWPVIVFLLVQVAGAAVVASSVERLTCDVREIKSTMVTSKEWGLIQGKRDDQISNIRLDVSEVKQQLDKHLVR
jgi:hypothetical protein